MDMTNRNPIVGLTCVGNLKSRGKKNIRATYDDVLEGSKCTYIGQKRTLKKGFTREEMLIITNFVHAINN